MTEVLQTNYNEGVKNFSMLLIITDTSSNVTESDNFNLEYDSLNTEDKLIVDNFKALMESKLLNL